MNSKFLLAALCFSIFSADGFVFSSSIIMSHIAKSYEITNAWNSLILGMFTCSLFMSCLLYMVLKKKIDNIAVMKVAILLLAISYMLIAVSMNVVMLMVSLGILCGLASGLVFFMGVIIALKGFDYPGLATGLVTASSAIGSIIIPVSLEYIISLTNWRTVFVGQALLICVLLIPRFDKVEDKESKAKNGSIDIISFIGLIIMNLANHMVFFVPYIFVYQQIQIDNPAIGALFISFLGATQIPGRILSGVIIDKEWMTAVGLNLVAGIILTISFIGFFFSPHIVMTLISAGLFSLGSSIGACTIGLTANEVSTGNQISTVITTLTLVSGLGCISTSLICGMLSSTFGIDSIFILCIISSFITAIGALIAVVSPTKIKTEIKPDKLPTVDEEELTVFSTSYTKTS